jgi:hypothetical protein
LTGRARVPHSDTFRIGEDVREDDAPSRDIPPDVNFLCKP